MRCRLCRYMWGINEMQSVYICKCGGINETVG